MSKLPRSSTSLVELLAIKPAQRTQEDVEQLITYLSAQPFFRGVSSASLELLSTCITLQRAAPGEVVLHPGEITDRLYLLLGGSCSVVRHSRREGFQPQQPARMEPGQTLCEAALVQSGRKSDVGITAAPPPADAAAGGAAGAGGQAPAGAAAGAATGAAAGAAAAGGRGSGGGNSGAGAGGGDGGGGGAVLAVVTRAAWSNMCARAPMKPEYGEARLSLLCCCARAIASVDPAVRTLEQCEDLAALLRLLPGLSHTSAPVLRAMSEAAYLRQLPPGTIMFEECTRAESEFVVLAGLVETHVRPKRQGAANRAALRSALRSAVAASRAKSAKGGPRGPAVEAPKTVRQKIEEERRAREAIKQSLMLQREGLRTPPARAQSDKPKGARAVEEEFKKWMLEFLSRKRANDNPTLNSLPQPAPVEAAKPGAGASHAADPKVANAWRRAAFKATHTQGPGEGGDGAEDEDDGDNAAARDAVKRSDTTLAEYERRKQEEAGGMRDVGNLLGGAAARKAYMRGLANGGGTYGSYEDLPDDKPEDDLDSKVRWDAGAAAAGQDLHDAEDIDEDEEAEDPWVRLTFLDRRYRVVQKAIRYIDAVEKVMGVSKGDSKGTQDGGAPSRPAKERDYDPEDPRNADDIHLLLLSGNEAAADGDADADGGDDGAASSALTKELVAAGGSGGAAATAAGRGSGGGSTGPAAAAAGPGPDVDIDDACDEHLDQLYGPRDGSVDPGLLVGELPASLMDRSAKGVQRPRRAHSAIAGPNGADVLVVVLETLRRGHDAARDDLVTERLAMLTALEPLRGLSDEHQAQLALGCSVVSYDANHIVVRQGQHVDALYVVLEGEVRLLDETENTLAAAAAAASPAGATTPAAPGGAAGGAAPAAPAAPAGAAAASASGAGGTANGGGPDSPFRSGAHKMVSIKTRRAAASFSALTLLGPGGSFGESVLGYPEDLATADGGDGATSSTQYLAMAMTSRPTKLLVLPRTLLLKYGYLRSSLPPFADLRREALNSRRQQLKASLQNRAAPNALAVATASNGPEPAGGGGSGGGGGGGAASAATGGGVITVPQPYVQLPVLSSPTAAAAAAYAVSVANSFQTPRPPPMRSSDALEHLGYKPVLRRVYKASPANGGTSVPSVTTVNGPNSQPGSGASSFSAAGGAAAAAAAVAPLAIDRQRRQDLLAASSFAVNAPQSLINAMARARGEDGGGPYSQPHTSLPNVISHSSFPPRRASADGTAAGLSAVASSPTGATAGLQLPLSISGARPLAYRMSMSGLGGASSAAAAAGAASPHDGSASAGTSPARRSSMSGVVITNGGGGGGGAAAAAAAIAAAGGSATGAYSSPQRGGRLHIGTTSTSTPTLLSASVMLPRLSVPGNATLGQGLNGITGTGAKPAQAARSSSNATPGVESFLTRLDAANSSGGAGGGAGGGGPGSEGSPRSFSPQSLTPLRNAGRSGSTGAVGIPGGGGGALTSAPVPMLGQRMAGQTVARA